MPLLQTSLLRLRDFRALGASGAFDWLAAVAEQVALGWLTLELTDSPLIVGVALGLRMVPLLLVGIPAGVLADRGDRVRLLRATALLLALAGAVPGVLALAGVVRVWHLLVLTFAGGCVRALQQAARQSYIHDLVGAAGLINALALLGIAMRVGGLVGSLLGGALTARFGAGAAYLAAAAGYLASAAALLPAQAGPGHAAPEAGSVWHGFADFVRALRHDRLLPGLIVLTAGAEMLGFSHQAVLPSLARDVLAVGADGLGAMTGARSIGGILGILLVTALGQARASGGVFLAVLLVFGASLVCLSFASSFVWVLLLLVVVNGVGGLSDILSQSLIQLTAPRGQRGRAGGAWVVAIGTAPLGQLQVGALASLVGVSVALGVSGVALILITAAAALAFPRLRTL
jgi:MFS family permease